METLLLLHLFLLPEAPADTGKSSGVWLFACAHIQYVSEGLADLGCYGDRFHDEAMVHPTHRAVWR